VTVLDKPFAPSTLLQAIRERLDADGAMSGSSRAHCGRRSPDSPLIS
jgi:hypothetical protein